jgi:hypothetical protein
MVQYGAVALLLALVQRHAQAHACIKTVMIELRLLLVTLSLPSLPRNQTNKAARGRSLVSEGAALRVERSRASVNGAALHEWSGFA